MEINKKRKRKKKLTKQIIEIISSLIKKFITLKKRYFKEIR